jgi:hypothetical protein
MVTKKKLITCIGTGIYTFWMKLIGRESFFFSMKLIDVDVRERLLSTFNIFFCLAQFCLTPAYIDFILMLVKNEPSKPTRKT